MGQVEKDLRGGWAGLLATGTSVMPARRRESRVQSSRGRPARGTRHRGTVLGRGGWLGDRGVAGTGAVMGK